MDKGDKDSRPEKEEGFLKYRDPTIRRTLVFINREHLWKFTESELHEISDKLAFKKIAIKYSTILGT